MVADSLRTYSRPRHQEPFLDVWSRTAPRYRRRAVVLLCLTALLFAGLCVFTYWLRTGEYGPTASASYWRLMRNSINPVGLDQVTLVDFLLFPISVEQVPVHMVIMGLLLASLASIPILVGILYRFPSSVAFCAMIAFLAAMPWYAATILLGCVIASHRAFRLKFRYASAILGLLPVVIYFLSATRAPESAHALATPYRFKLYLPWVLAVLGSCLICGVALGIARLINYRPGGIAPVLAVLFAVPVLLFHAEVGRDELEYRLLEHAYGPNSVTAFTSADLRAIEERRAERLWAAARHELFDAILLRGKQRRAEEAAEQLAEQRAAAVAACDEFMEYYPSSRYVPCVLYIKGRALDLRLNQEALEREDRIEHYGDVPSAHSRSPWESLATNFPDAPPAAVAFNRLAVFALRDGRTAEAAAAVESLFERFGPSRATESALEVSVQPVLLTRAAPSSTLGISISLEVRRARELADLIEASRDEPPSPWNPIAPDAGVLDGPPTHPLTALASLDRHHPAHHRSLAAIAVAFPHSAVYPGVVAQLALLDPVPSRRIERLAEIERSLAGRPQRAEVLLRYADALAESARYAEAVRALERLKDDYPLSCWGTAARERLASLALMALPG